MNRQFSLFTASVLFSMLICCSACDLGTYNQRFQNRPGARSATPAAPAEANEPNETGAEEVQE